MRDAQGRVICLTTNVERSYACGASQATEKVDVDRDG